MPPAAEALGIITRRTARASRPLARTALPGQPRLFHSSPIPRASQAAEQYDSLYSSSYRGQGSRGDRKPWYKSPTTLVLGFVPIFTLGLGVWQVKRLKWKVELIDEVGEKLKREPLRLPRDIDAASLEPLSFRRVLLSGTFDHSRTLFLGPRVREGVMGYHVVVPLRRDEGGGEVLVDRGFVAETQIVGKGKDRRLKNDAALPNGHVTLTCVLPRIYPRNAFTPANDASTNSWFHVEPQQMAAYASGPAGPLPLLDSKSQATAAMADFDPKEEDLHTPSAGVAHSVKSLLGRLGSGGAEEDAERGRVLPVFLEEVFAGHAGDASYKVQKGIPVGRPPTIELRNSHAIYAATWFSLSAATAGMFGFLVRRGR